MLSYLPVGFDKNKAESLFTETVSTEAHQREFEPLLLMESTEKIRKRVLISSTFATASRAKHILRIFRDLRNCKTLAPTLFKRAPPTVVVGEK